MQGAMLETKLGKIVTTLPMALINEKPAPDLIVQTANGNFVVVQKEVLIRFSIADKLSEETFMICPVIGKVLNPIVIFRTELKNARHPKTHIPLPRCVTPTKQGQRQTQLRNMLNQGNTENCATTIPVSYGPSMHQCRKWNNH